WPKVLKLMASSNSARSRRHRRWRQSDRQGPRQPPWPSVVPALAGGIDNRFPVGEMHHAILGRKPVDGALVREALDQVAQDAQDAAMRDDDRGANQRGAEIEHALRDILIALAPGRPEMPE